AAKIAQESQRTRLEANGDYLQLAVERRSDGRVIGQMYFTVDNAEYSALEIGWVFHPDVARQGYAAGGCAFGRFGSAPCVLGG
ncbi:GNAT family N-acetyltransferase, partial [Mycetocola sp.]|uniref:GNAT family N-acetyltransferase n=1 Tax=Mycetocola sp. TaxID=1871042 RepID=UPI00345C1A8A|nr:N-acetyltransferase [Mycetocola sp.]